MGKLFWKFFIFFWLAQVTTAIGVGIAMWLNSPGRDQSHADIFRSQPPKFLVASAASTLRHGGNASLPTSDFPPPEDRPELPPHGRSILPPLMPLLAGSLVSLVFAAFKSVAYGNLNERLVPIMGKQRDELADLGRDFDSMAQQLQQLMDGQKRVLHDVSHELRSPLARLQAAIGLARQQPERTEDSMARIEREAERIDKLVSELLTLSRLEAGMTGKLDEDVDLHELLSNVMEDACFEAEASGCHINFEAQSQTVIQGNAELLHRAIENIVRNAIKHSPIDGIITISMQKIDKQTICISVQDEGEGVMEADTQSIFEPFFRSEKSKKSDGHGLRLAISQRVIHAHHGTILANNHSTGGLCVTITLAIKLSA